MRWNTRFCPTITGAELHVGHLYTVLVNEREAHRSGGRFSIRIDDTQKYWSDKLGSQSLEIGNRYITQIKKFVDVDFISWQSKMPQPATLIGNHQKYIYDTIFSNVEKEQMIYDLVCEWIPDRDMMMYPYTTHFTFEKVVWDYYEGVNWIIRGEDLVTEAAFYHFFGDLFGFPWVLQTYLPRLRANNREELRNTPPISKRHSNFQLSKQIDRFGVDGVIELLKQSCLIDPTGDFYLENIKWNPTIIGFEP